MRVLLAVSILAVVVCGCGGDDDGPATTSTAVPAATTPPVTPAPVRPQRSVTRPDRRGDVAIAGLDITSVAARLDDDGAITVQFVLAAMPPVGAALQFSYRAAGGAGDFVDARVQPDGRALRVSDRFGAGASSHSRARMSGSSVYLIIEPGQRLAGRISWTAGAARVGRRPVVEDDVSGVLR